LLRPKDAVSAAEAILNGARLYERGRLNRIRAAVDANTPPTVEIPDKAPDVMRHLAWKAKTNVLPLVVDVFAQSMKVDGYRSAKNPNVNAKPWETWQANRLRARQVGLYRSTLTYGAAYVIVTPGLVPGAAGGGDVVRAKLQCVSPLGMTAVYEDPVNDEWPMLALYVDGPILRLYDEEAVYYIGVEAVPPRSGLAPQFYQELPNSYSFIEAREHKLGVCPVARFRDRMLLDGEEVFGIVEPLISIQQRVDETVFGQLTAQFYSAFKQRYVIGWIPESEQEKLAANASQLWTFKDGPGDVQIGELDETDLTRYISAKEAAVSDMAAIAQVPAQALGGSIKNISAEALAALQDGKDRTSDEITDSLGESWRSVLQLAARAEGDEESANDFTAQVTWQDVTARSLAQTVDALGKLAQMLEVPKRALWSRVPGVTQTDVQEWQALADQSDAIGNLASLLDQQAQTAATPAAPPASTDAGGTVTGPA
jgi:hypothetical protein